MSKLNEIQNELAQIEGGRFQKIGDVYLIRKYGYTIIESRGSMLGTDKTISGTPDTIFQAASGKFVFAQYTTQFKGLYAKLEKDIKECLDETKTHISVNAVEEIVLAHNSRSDVLTEHEKNVLQSKAEQVGWRLSFVDVEQISIDLWMKFHNIAEEFLGISIDTGQILEYDQFVSQYGRGNPTSPLHIPFHFREQELAQALQHLEVNDLLVITGPAGVGKTRFALACCEQFIALHPTYQVRYVFNKGVPIHRDIKVELSPSGDHLLFVDDVNRVAEREYILNMLREERVDRKIKLVVTVRDYAVDSVRDFTPAFGGSGPLTLANFTSEQLRELVATEFNIRNTHYQDRIVEIAKGNVRLAVMAAHIAFQHNTLMSIADASDLYDEYFASFQQSDHAFLNRQHLKVAGIVALLRVLDRANQEYMQQVYKVFGLSEELFWNSIYALHDAEVIDLYDNEVVKISDQVMSTYLIYKVFFRERLIDLSAPLIAFFFHRPCVAADVLYPVLSTFHNKKVLSEVEKVIEQVWPHFIQDEDTFMQFLTVFWFVKPTETLSYVHDQIQLHEPTQLDPSKLCFDPQKSKGRNSILEILRAFNGAQLAHFRLAVQILHEVATKQHNLLPDVVAMLVQDFGFCSDSYLERYQKQSIVVEATVTSVKETPNIINVGIFLYVAKKYLETQFRSGHMEDKIKYVWREFYLQPSLHLILLRKKIWAQLFVLLESPEFKFQALHVIREYIHYRSIAHTPEIAKEDAANLLPYMQSSLPSGVYKHCQLVHDYLDLLDKMEIAYEPILRIYFVHEALGLAEVLLPDLRWFKLSVDEYQAKREQLLLELAERVNLAEWSLFFEYCRELTEAAEAHQVAQICHNLEQLFWLLAEKKREQFPQFVAEYLALGDPLTLNPFGIVFKLIEVLGAAKALNLLRVQHAELLDKWLFAFYVNIPPEDVCAEHLPDLLRLYSSAPLSAVPNRFDYLARYTGYDPKILVTVTQLILNRQDRSQTSNLLQNLLPHDAVSTVTIVTAFRDDILVLEEAYFIVRFNLHWADYGATTFNLLLDLDSSFATRYVEWWFRHHDQHLVYAEHFDYTNLWQRTNYVDVMQQILKAVQSLPSNGYFNRYDYFKPFFVPPNLEQKREAGIDSHILSFLDDLIKHQSQDLELMEAVFEIVAEILPHQRKRLLATFLNHNQSSDDFQSISLFQFSWPVSDSQVSILEKEIELLQSLLPLLGELRFMKHRVIVEEQIRDRHARIDRELRRQFAQNDW